ncbi:MAG TPA: ribosomal protein S18-alanine N-acetyltransferase [Bacillota bacterium]|nr:ribosomal protein S18-alanine N-acetyltransferase [Bacillota bacterium]HPT86480.1 ribosomal protein S18-alanine N-acetyltransferase [Bacillota bacterium]
MVKIQIMPMTLEDVESVVEIEERSFPIPWSRNSFLYELLENERAVYLVAKDGYERVIGYVGLWIVFDEGHITNLAVHPLYRRQGVAQALIQGLIETVRPMGVQHLTLEVRVSNRPAQQLYEKMGFVQVGIRRKYYLDNNEDAFIMWKGPL